MAEQLIFDYRQAELDDRERALCDFAIRLTLDPSGMNQGDVDRVRQHGFNDEAITIAIEIVSYFNFINRVADAVGVDTEKWMDPYSRDDWQQRRGTGYLETIER